MDPPQRIQPTVRYATRTSMRRAIYSIIRRVIMQRLAQQQQQRRAQVAAQGAEDANNAAPLRLNKSQRRKALQQSHLLEDILYRRACSLDEYQDPSTLNQRVVKAGRAVYITSQLRGREGRRGRTERERVANAMGNYARGYENESSQSRRRDTSSEARAAARPNPPIHPAHGA